MTSNCVLVRSRSCSARTPRSCRCSHDLYDLVYVVLFEHDVEFDRLQVVRTFLEKTIFSRSLVPDSLVRAHAFFCKAVEAFPFWQDDLKPKLQDTLSQYVGAQARFALRPDVQRVEEWLAQKLAVSFAADAGR